LIPFQQLCNKVKEIIFWCATLLVFCSADLLGQLFYSELANESHDFLGLEDRKKVSLLLSGVSLVDRPVLRIVAREEN
jgi:hypothetical protein